MKIVRTLALTSLVSASFSAVAQDAKPNAYTQLMDKATTYAAQHRAKQRPFLSPEFKTVLKPGVNVDELHSKGIKVVVWTPDDLDSMRKLIQKHVDGIISDDPEMLQQVLNETLRNAKGDHAWGQYLAAFDAQAHRGGRADRPENTLPSFENGIDNGVTTLETDTGVTSDGVSLIWHDYYLNPNSCRKADGSEYTEENKVWVHDITMAEAAKTFICDKTPYAKHDDKFDFSGKQKNDLKLSPVSVAFAKKEGMASPYSPTNAAQLFRFVKFYTEYYTTGEGKNAKNAKQKAANGAKVRINPETKIATPESSKHSNASPEEFLKALGGAIEAEGMQARVGIQSFYFPTLLLFQQKYPAIPVFYLTSSEKQLHAKSMPKELSLDE